MAVEMEKRYNMRSPGVFVWCIVMFPLLCHYYFSSSREAAHERGDRAEGTYSYVLCPASGSTLILLPLSNVRVIRLALSSFLLPPSFPLSVSPSLSQNRIIYSNGISPSGGQREQNLKGVTTTVESYCPPSTP